ncbi:MAG: hypothetical protein ABI551_20100 [Polyangiaceae bacterium]
MKTTARIGLLASLVALVGCGATQGDADVVVGSNGDGGPSVVADRDGGSSDASTSVGELPTGRFRIAMWCGAPPADLTQARVDEMANDGFTTISNACENDAYSAAYNETMLSLAKTDGLDAIVMDQRILDAYGGAATAPALLDSAVADYGNNPALAGYFLTDEPSAGSFSHIADVVSGLKTRDAAHFTYVNLLPSYATLGQLGVPTYDQYVAQFLASVKPEIVSFDHYPFLSDGTDTTTFFSDLATMRTLALASGVSFFQFVQSVEFPGCRATNGPEKLWEGMQTLAFGGAGISYFRYWGGIIDGSGNQTSQYADVKNNNERFAAFGKFLTAAKSKAVFVNGPLALGTVPRVPGAAAYLPSTAPITVGLFDVERQGASVPATDQYVFLANRDYKSTTESDVFLAGTSTPELLDVTSGKFKAISILASDPVSGQKVHVSLAPGDGALIHLAGPAASGAPGAEAFVATVRADQATLDIVDSHFGDGLQGAASWDQCPEGYAFGGHAFASDGFWLCVRKDLASHTFYVGDVIADQATLFSAVAGVATATGAASWDSCPAGKLLGHRFDSNGYWLCMQ